MFIFKKHVGQWDRNVTINSGHGSTAIGYSHAIAGMRRNLGRSLLSFSFSRSNRIGSDELIAGEKTATATTQSRERLAKLGESWVDVDRLMSELAEKETVISDLRRKLQRLELQSRSQSGMTRSASITSGMMRFIVANQQSVHG